MPPSLKPTDEQRDTAALWLARHSGGTLSAEERRELDDWLNEDPVHRHAWDEMRVLWARLEEPARHAADKSQPRGAFGHYFHGTRGWMTLAGAAAAVIAVVWVAEPNVLENMRADVVSGRSYATSVKLPDGSVVQVGADTALAFRFDERNRHVRLLRGEAFFEVTPGSTPAFTVDIDGDTVRVVGTRFNIDRVGGKTIVAVEEGKVAVSGSSDPKTDSLVPGQQVSVDDGMLGPVEQADLEASLGWLSGRLVVRQETVSDVVSALSRHTSKRLVVRGSLAQQRISGTFALDDIDGSLDTIASAVGATVVRQLPLVTFIF